MADRAFQEDDIGSPGIRHPAFGLVGISHVSGERSLFGVDYPQGHYVTLTIQTAKLNRTNSSDYVFADREIIRIAMSEVQFARMISSPNHGDGVACTLERYNDPVTGAYTTPKLEDHYAGKVESFAAEAQARAVGAAENLRRAKDLCDEMMRGKVPTKAALKELQDNLFFAEQEMTSNIGYVVRTAEESINKAAENAKTEFNAHVDYTLTRLGERALGEAALKLAGGMTAKDVGLALTHVAAPAESDA